MDQFNLEIISPEKSFLTKSDIEEVVIPAVEGYMGILKDHIPLISFLKPSKTNEETMTENNPNEILIRAIFFISDEKKEAFLLLSSYILLKRFIC